MIFYHSWLSKINNEEVTVKCYWWKQEIKVESIIANTILDCFQRKCNMLIQTLKKWHTQYSSFLRLHCFLALKSPKKYILTISIYIFFFHIWCIGHLQQFTDDFLFILLSSFLFSFSNILIMCLVQKPQKCMHQFWHAWCYRVKG